MQVQTINFTNNNAATQFTQSLRETGFAVLNNHPIDTDKINAVYQEWKDFFNSESKFNYSFDKTTQDGYFPFLSETAKDNNIQDLKEFYHYYPWGKFPNQLSGKTRELYYDLSNLAGVLLTWVEQNTPAEIASTFSMPLTNMIKDSNQTLFRILHYPPLTGTEQKGAVRAFDHEDINLITLLPAATAPGLQVLDAQGNWLPIDCNPGNIVVNTGDMLQLCSKQYYRSTTHRVVNPDNKNEARLSMPLFLHPRPEVRLSETHTQHSYLQERLKEIGLI